MSRTVTETRGTPAKVSGYASVRLSTAEGRRERIDELNALADYYADQGCADTAAEYRAQARELA